MSWTRKTLGDDEISRILKEYFQNEFEEEYILYGEEECALPIYMDNYVEQIKNFEVREDDVFVCTFPKTGTTWTQEMVWLIANGLNYEAAKVDLTARFPFLELCALGDFDKLAKVLGESPYFVHHSIEYTNNLKSPRYIKSHLPFSLLPDQIKNGTKTPKIIYVVRNPKDACVSYYHHGKLLQGWRPTIEDFSKVFMTNKIMYGSFWKHVLGFWERRNTPNLLIISYEEMKQDQASVIKKVAAFLNKNYTDEQIAKLCRHLSFDSMKKNKAVNGERFVTIRKEKNLALEDGTFLRSGTVGKYKEELSPEIIEMFNVWIKENAKGTGFEEKYNYAASFNTINKTKSNL